jgi:hypothetical protein
MFVIIDWIGYDFLLFVVILENETKLRRRNFKI